MILQLLNIWMTITWLQQVVSFTLLRAVLIIVKFLMFCDFLGS